MYNCCSESALTYFACSQLFPDSLLHLINSGFVLGFSLVNSSQGLHDTYICSGYILNGFLLLTSGPTLLLEFRISFKFSLCWLLIPSEFALGQFYTGFFSGPICSGLVLPLDFFF